jgi:pyridoxine/pyridoxamine 5'-phosphate oxidase
MTKADILAFIKTQIHTVISTTDPTGHPEAALIGFGETDTFELIFGTYRTSRKYQNLQQNSRVACVIGWDSDNITVQYEGIATELQSNELAPYLALYHAKVPSAASYQNHPDQRYFKISPRWLRYSDLSGDEEFITEITFS